MKRQPVCFVVWPLLLYLAPMTVEVHPERVQAAVSVAVARPQEVVSPDSWCYSALRQLEVVGIHTGFCFGTCGRRPWTRGEFAQAITHVMAPLADAPTNLVRQDLQTRLQTHPLARAALLRLVNEFGPELTALGQDVPAAEARIAAILPISPPFPDVPKTHWAYQGVETLRKAGILTGESGGTFHD